MWEVGFSDISSNGNIKIFSDIDRLNYLKIRGRGVWKNINYPLISTEMKRLESKFNVFTIPVENLSEFNFFMLISFRIYIFRFDRNWIFIDFLFVQNSTSSIGKQWVSMDIFCIFHFTIIKRVISKLRKPNFPLDH